jgi:hypothetical protein
MTSSSKIIQCKMNVTEYLLTTIDLGLNEIVYEIYYYQ